MYSWLIGWLINLSSLGLKCINITEWKLWAYVCSESIFGLWMEANFSVVYYKNFLFLTVKKYLTSKYRSSTPDSKGIDSWGLWRSVLCEFMKFLCIPLKNTLLESIIWYRDICSQNCIKNFNWTNYLMMWLLFQIWWSILQGHFWPD